MTRYSQRIQLLPQQSKALDLKKVEREKAFVPIPEEEGSSTAGGSNNKGKKRKRERVEEAKAESEE
jgi:hypothetical protein